MFLREGWIRLSRSSGLCLLDKRRGAGTKRTFVSAKLHQACACVCVCGDFNQTANEVMGTHLPIRQQRLESQRKRASNQTLSDVGFISFGSLSPVPVVSAAFAIISAAAGLRARLRNTTFFKCSKASRRRRAATATEATRGEARGGERRVGGGRGEPDEMKETAVYK